MVEIVGYGFVVMRMYEASRSVVMLDGKSPIF